MMAFRTAGGNFTGVLINANGFVVTTDANSAPMANMSRAGCLAYAAANGWTVLAV